jgi:glutaredoxin 2
MSQTIPVFGLPIDEETIEPSTQHPMVEIKKILYRLKWVEDQIKSGNNANNYNLEYLSNRVRDMEGFLAVMDADRIRATSRKYFKKREQARKKLNTGYSKTQEVEAHIKKHIKKPKDLVSKKSKRKKETGPDDVLLH